VQPDAIFLSYSIQFVYEYYRIEKQERFCLLSMLPLRVAIMTVFCSFFKSFSLPTVSNLYSEIFNKFFAL